jgi:hypothetical protein
MSASSARERDKRGARHPNPVALLAFECFGV